MERLTTGVDEILADSDGTAPIDAEGLTSCARSRMRGATAGMAEGGRRLDGLLAMSAQLFEMRVAAERRTARRTAGTGASRRSATATATAAARRGGCIELMLLAGEAVAQYAEDEGVPLVYRRQAMREIDAAEVDELPAGPAARGRSSAARRRRPPARGGAGLGLDRYAQCTSPIRRYGDLAIHHQIKAAIREIPPFLTASSSRLDAEAGARQLERAANARWLTEFLRRRAGQPLRAVVLGAHMDSRRSEEGAAAGARSDRRPQERARPQAGRRFRSRPTDWGAV